MLCRLKECQKCRGDLVLDGEEWRCWQCGHYYYPNMPEMQLEGIEGLDVQRMRHRKG